MLILKGTKTVDLSKDELTEIIGQFDRVHIDLGTGDGRNIYKLAINDQKYTHNSEYHQKLRAASRQPWLSILSNPVR